MEQKTKEIVERLQKVLDAPESWREHDTDALSVAIVPVQAILDAVIELRAKASLIESLSERVGELERGSRTAVRDLRALSKQGEGS